MKRKNKWCKSKPSPQADWCPARSKQWQPLKSPWPPILLLHMILYGIEYQYSFGRFRSGVPAVFPQSFLWIPSLLITGAEGGMESGLTLCKFCSAIANTSVCYEDWSQIQNILPYKLLWRKLTPSQPDAVYVAPTAASEGLTSILHFSSYLCIVFSSVLAS